MQGFTCANHQTGYVWALFVIDGAQGRGHGTALLDAAMARPRQAGHRQAFLSTERGTRAEGFYLSRGWQPTGVSMKGEVVFVCGFDQAHTLRVRESLSPHRPPCCNAQISSFARSDPASCTREACA
jgi:GNAT superfamily N-acetyltransferase